MYIKTTFHAYLLGDGLVQHQERAAAYADYDTTATEIYVSHFLRMTGAPSTCRRH